MQKRNIRITGAIIAAWTWMNISEFVRNSMLLHDQWVEGFQNLGLPYPSEPINGIVWVAWIGIFVCVLAYVSTRFNALASTLITWPLGFVLMWITMINLGVFPIKILYWAVPWSFVEVYLAALICRGVLPKQTY